MDSILIVGRIDEKLPPFFEKVGYKLYSDRDPAGAAAIVDTEVIDLILIDAGEDKLGHEFCEFFRKHERTRETPIVVLCPDRLQVMQIKDLHFDKVECLQAPYSLGTVASKVATSLRIRKMAGKDDRASLAEVNAALRDLNERHARELQEARAIQKGLLPTALPADPAFDIAATYEPLEEVGGDWYHIGKTASGKLQILLADVTGHGLAAAFIGSMTKLALSAANRDLPGELLFEMNRLMAPNIPQGRFVTANAYLYDPRTGALAFGRAGGPAALLLRRQSGETVELKGEGFPIGFFEDSEYKTEQTTLLVGDLLVIITDGITEAQNRGSRFFGTEGLANAVRKTTSNASAAEVLETIKSDFKTFLDGRILKDDVTIVVLTRTA